MPDEPADSDNLLGAFIRAQRQMANLSLRELAAQKDFVVKLADTFAPAKTA